MSVISIPKPLREKLGDEATDAFVEVIREIELESKKELATKDDIRALKDDIIKIEGEIKLIKWIISVMLAGVISLVLKAFFIS